MQPTPGSAPVAIFPPALGLAHSRTLGAGVLLIALAATARSQWSVGYLHPGGSGSRAYGVRGDQQVGLANNRACLWNGTAASAVDLHPPIALASWCLATDGTAQVGQARVAGTHAHASLWTGSAGSWVDLHPASALDSFCFGVEGSQQVGEVWPRSPYAAHAALWSGSAGSWVDLHPAGATDSHASAVASGRQVGMAYIPALGGWRASLWTGAASSWVDLTPFSGSDGYVHGADASQEVGQALWASIHRASLWTGTAASWVSLHPPGAAESSALGVHGGQQVGYTFISGREGACLWSGTSASWMDLHAMLPAGFSRSRAQSIWHVGAATYVAGYGYNNLQLRDEALLWVLMPPENYGAGCPGTGGLVPAMRAVGAPVLGNAGFGVRVLQGRPNAGCLVFANIAPASIPVGGCTVLVTQPSLNFFGVTDNSGVFTLGLPIPNRVELAGSEIYWQGLVADPAGALFGLASMSDGLRVRIGS